MNDKINIIIVEDEALIAENLKLTLIDLGYEVSAICYDYAAAIEIINRDTADLVLLDINLNNKNPAQNGLALGNIIAKVYQIPFIFLTAYSDKDTITEASKLYPGSYLIKPVNAAALFAAIQTTIENHQLKSSNKSLVTNIPPHYFFVKVGHINYKLLWRDMYCIEVSKNYVLLKAADKTSVYPIRGSLHFITEQLIPEILRSLFVRINRHVCVNKNHVTSFNAQEVFCNGEVFENTRFNFKELQDALS